MGVGRAGKAAEGCAAQRRRLLHTERRRKSRLGIFCSVPGTHLRKVQHRRQASHLPRCAALLLRLLRLLRRRLGCSPAAGRQRRRRRRPPAAACARAGASTCAAPPRLASLLLLPLLLGRLCLRLLGRRHALHHPSQHPGRLGQQSLAVGRAVQPLLHQAGSIHSMLRLQDEGAAPGMGTPHASPTADSRTSRVPSARSARDAPAPHTPPTWKASASAGRRMSSSTAVRRSWMSPTLRGAQCGVGGELP